MSRMFNALSMQFKKQIAEGTGAVAFDGVKCYLPKATFYGECLQDGTPTPENPVPVLCNNAKWTTPVWNQLIPAIPISPTKIGWNAASKYSYEVVDGAYKIVFNQTYTSGGAVGPYIEFPQPISTGHKYYYSFAHKFSHDVQLYGDEGKPVVGPISASNDFIKTSGVYTAQFITNSLNQTITPEDEFFIKDIMTIDLTTVFGPGNEPSTVEEFEAWAKANGHDLDTYQPYDEGTPIGGTVDLSLLPNGGLYGIGDVQDEWDCVSGDGIRRIGKVDLGTLNWTYLNIPSWNCFVSIVSSKKIEQRNMVCEKYQRKNIFGTVEDNILDGNSNSTNIYIRDGSFNNDPVAFKAAMSGVMLYFELETPVPFHTTPQPLTEANGLNTLMQISGDIVDTDVSVEYVKHS